MRRSVEFSAQLAFMENNLLIMSDDITNGIILC